MTISEVFNLMLSDPGTQGLDLSLFAERRLVAADSLKLFKALDRIFILPLH